MVFICPWLILTCVAFQILFEPQLPGWFHFFEAWCNVSTQFHGEKIFQLVIRRCSLRKNLDLGTPQILSKRTYTSVFLASITAASPIHARTPTASDFHLSQFIWALTPPRQYVIIFIGAEQCKQEWPSLFSFKENVGKNALSFPGDTYLTQQQVITSLTQQQVRVQARGSKCPKRNVRNRAGARYQISQAPVSNVFHDVQTQGMLLHHITPLTPPANTMNTCNRSKLLRRRNLAGETVVGWCTWVIWRQYLLHD